LHKVTNLDLVDDCTINMSDSSDRNGEIIEDAEENKEFIFFMYKERKERRFKNLAEEYEKIFNVPIMSKHLSKKIVI
jgi:hypothetical protein